MNFAHIVTRYKPNVLWQCMDNLVIQWWPRGSEWSGHWPNTIHLAERWGVLTAACLAVFLPLFSIPFGVEEGETDKTDLHRRQLCYQLLSVHSTPWMLHSLLELLCRFIFHSFPIFRASPSFSLLPLLLSFYSSFCGHLLLYTHFSLCTTSQCVHSLPMPFTITISDYH